MRYIYSQNFAFIEINYKFERTYYQVLFYLFYGGLPKEMGKILMSEMDTNASTFLKANTHVQTLPENIEFLNFTYRMLIIKKYLPIIVYEYTYSVIMT